MAASLASTVAVVEVGAMASFVREIAYVGEIDFRFILHHRHDRERDLTLTILVPA
jgi:hypothetical protein